MTFYILFLLYVAVKFTYFFEVIAWSEASL